MPRKKNELDTQLDQAKKSGKWMVAVWRVTDGKLEMFRETNGFPMQDISSALEQLREDLRPLMLEKGKVANTH